MKTFIIANAKGGVGKTTTAVTLASGYAAMGERVLLIDTDVQGNIAYFLGLPPADELFELLVVEKEISAVVYEVTYLPKLSVIRSFRKTAVVESMLTSQQKDYLEWDIKTLLRIPLAAAQNEYDIVFIDTAPALSSIQQAALYASDFLIIPAIPEYASEAGVSQLATTVHSIDAKTSLLGVLPMMVDSRSREHAQTISEMEKAFPGLVLPRVRKLIALGEAPRAGLPIWWYAPSSEAAKDFAAVLGEVQNRAS